MFKLRHALSILFVALLATVFASAQHFTYTETNFTMPYVLGDTVVPTINGIPLETGDEIGAFTQNGLCAGALVYTTGQTNQFNLYGKDNQQQKPGFSEGETVVWRIWDQSAGKEITVVNATFDADSIYMSPGVYSNSDYVIGIFNTIVGFDVPPAPNVFSPANNATGIAVSGNITWHPAPAANTYEYDLDDNSDFSSTIDHATNLTDTMRAYTGLSNNMTYYVRVRGVNNQGNGDWTTNTFKTAFAQVTLASPANNSKAINSNPVVLTWNAVSGATVYQIQIATDAAFTNIVTDNNNVSGTSFNFSGTSPLTNYYWKVRAVGVGNTGAYSSAFTFRTAVGAPVITNPVNNNMNTAVSGNITWNAVTGATKYKGDIATDAAFTNIVSSFNNVVTTSTPYAGLMNFTQYYIRVYAGDADGFGMSSSITFKTKVGTPNNQTPANLAKAQPLSGNVVWSSVPNATNYDVQIATDAAFTNVVGSFNAVANTMQAYSALTNNTTYFWHVRANSVNGAGEWSTTTNFETELAMPTIMSPIAQSDCNGTSGQITWGSVAGAENYDVQIATDANFTNILVDQQSVSQLNANYSGLMSRAQHFARVRGKKVGSIGPWSSTLQFMTTFKAPNAASPVPNERGVAKSGSIKIHPVAGAQQYTITLSTDANFTNVLFTQTSPDTMLAFSGLANGTNYFVRAKAIDGSCTNGDWLSYSFETLLGPITITSPTQDENDVLLNGDATWNALPLADSYEIQITSTPGDFSTPIFAQSNISGTSVLYMGLLPDHDHGIRGRAVRSGKPGEWSAEVTFHTVAIETPLLLSPANNAQNQLKSVKCVWKSINNALSYNFQAATDAGFTNLLVDVNTTDTTAMVSGLGYANTVYWRVQAVSELGNSNWANAFMFTTLAAPMIDGANSVCFQTVHNYNVVNPIGIADYAWVVTGGTIQGNANGTSISVLWNVAGSQTVKFIRTSGQWPNFADTATYSVFVNSSTPQPAMITVNSYYPNTACLNENLPFAASAQQPINTWTWNFGDNTPAVNGQNISHLYGMPGQYTVTLTGEGDNCLVVNATYQVTVTDTCPVTIVMPNQVDVCKDATPTFNNVVFGGKGGYSYYWHPAADFLNANVQKPTIKKASVSKYYTFTVVDQMGKQGLKQLYMFVRPAPTFSFSPLFLVLLNNSPIDLNSYVSNLQGGTQPYTYEWTLNGAPVADPTNVVPPAGTSFYYLTIMDANGCRSATLRFIVLKLNLKDGLGNVVTGVTGTGYMFSYPNPVRTDLNITAQLFDHQNVSLKVMNLLGVEEMSLDLGNTDLVDQSLDVSKLPAGVYTIILDSGTDIITQKFIKQ